MKTRTVAARDGVPLHVASCGGGPDVVVLSGGPGCVHYLADESLAPEGFRCWYPDPRGVGESSGGPHDMATALTDLEDMRRGLGIDSWIVLGHSWGSDLGLRYAVEHPGSVRGLVGLCGHGPHRDREWAAAYERGKAEEVSIPLDFEPAVHEALWESFKLWIHTPRLWRDIADCPVPMSFVSAGNDIRPSWPAEQLAELAPFAGHRFIAGMGHHFWFTDPAQWRSVVTEESFRIVDGHMIQVMGDDAGE